MMLSRSEGLLIAALTASSALLGGIIGSWFEFSAKSRATDVRMLEIALGILREDPEDSQLTAARGWAVDLINASTNTKMSEVVKQELIRLRLPKPFLGGGWDNYLGGGDLKREPNSPNPQRAKPKADGDTIQPSPAR